MNEILKQFRIKHDCKYCLYYRKKCKARDKCFMDYLPIDSPDEEIELFFIS